jgi:isocitrate dehydrogenase
MNSEKVAITMARGDGIGPEIMDATLRIIETAGANIAVEEIEIGEKVYLRGNSSGIEDSSWESLFRTKVFLKAPITTPQGGGFKSLNVTCRKTMGLYANIRPTVSYFPYVSTKHPIMDVVIVRENEEDLYAGIEHRQTGEVYQCLKLVSRPGCEKIVRYAFEYARAYGRKKVTCFVKDNIMKLTDGIFHKIFDEIAVEYPELEKEHWIVDIGAAKLADTPEAFDVIVMPNLYGDILSDVAAQIAGSVGLAGSSNIGDHGAMFEAIHGSAPRRAGLNMANPSGLLLGSIMMLNHIKQSDVAEKVHNAWLKTLEDGVHTYDIFKEGTSTRKVGTKEFADAIIERLGEKPEKFKPVVYTGESVKTINEQVYVRKTYVKETVGIDIFVDWAKPINELGEKIDSFIGNDYKLFAITNRGLKAYPGGRANHFTNDNSSCRFFANDGSKFTHENITDILNRFNKAGIDFIKTENLCTFDGERGYSL